MKIQMLPRDMIYVYDGSIAGFYTVVFEAVYSKTMPAAIIPENETEPTMLEDRQVETDRAKAVKVRNSVALNISAEALALIEDVFLSCMKEKELPLLRFLLLGYEYGAKVTTMLGHADVSPLVKAQKHLYNEAHLLKGFIRFSDNGRKLVSEISPKNFVLPYIAEHFTERYRNEDFMIYDKTHKTALIYENRRRFFIELEDFEMFEADETETRYRELWKRFYNAVAITERYNPKCRMTLCPKRYWENMLEMRELL